MFETLYAKTFSILSLQLFFTWMTTVTTIHGFRLLYAQRKLGLSASTTESGELDIHLNFDKIKIFFWSLLVIDLGVFLLLVFFGHTNLTLGISLFSVWSILTGLELALCLLAVDENLGGKVLAITTTITVISALIGTYSGINFIAMGPYLYGVLLLVLMGNLIRIFISIPRNKERIMALFGCIVFVGYLLFDFNHLAKASKNAALNTWPVAMDFAINIYLDVINLFLELLDLMSD